MLDKRHGNVRSSCVCVCVSVWLQQIHFCPHVWAPTQTRVLVNHANINSSPTLSLQGWWIIPQHRRRTPSRIPFSLVYTEFAVAVAPAGMLQCSHAPIRCQILGCFQATYIRLRGKRASNALKDVFPCLKASARVCFCARVNEEGGKDREERLWRQRERRKFQNISPRLMSWHAIMKGEPGDLTRMWMHCACLAIGANRQPPSSWLSSNRARPQREKNGKGARVVFMQHCVLRIEQSWLQS